LPAEQFGSTGSLVLGFPMLIVPYLVLLL